MRKVLLLTLAALLLSFTMSAQLLSSQDMKVHRAPYALQQFKSHTPRMMAPARADLADNQMIMGHYDSDDYESNGLGITGMPGTLPLGTILTPSELAMFQGGKIVKFRVALAAATKISRVFVIPVSATGVYGTTTAWNCDVNAVGWNEIELETPYEINLGDDKSLMIGFDYRQTSSNYPIAYTTQGTIYPTFLYAQNTWNNVGLDTYGNLCVQCVVEKDDFDPYLIAVGNPYTPTFTKLGEDIFFVFASRNAGTASSVPAGSVSYDIYIDGEFISSMTNERDLTRSFEDFDGTIPSDGLTVGRHTLTIVASELFGEPIESPMSTSVEFTLYESGFDHQMFLLEQFTSTYCTYCPLGINMLQVLMGMRDDIAWVGIHGNMNGTDPMRTLQCDSIMSYQGSDSYPSGSFNRSVGFESDDAIVTGLGYYEQYHNQVAGEISAFYDYLAEVPSFATVNINSTFDAETREAVITVDGELAPNFDSLMGDDCKLTVYITEDGIVARQLNQGTWVSNFVHNGVLRRAVNSVKGSDLNRDGNTYKNEFTYTIPSAWKAENLNIVAFISRPLANGASGVYTDLYVNQVNKRKLGEFDEPTMRGDVNGDGKVTIEDVTDLIDCLLSGIETVGDADCSLDGKVTIDDVTTLIDYLLSGVWAE